MKNETLPRYPLSEHTARTNFSYSGRFSLQRQEGITPGQLKRAYHYDGSLTGAGVKISVVAAFDNTAINESMRVFCREFGLSFSEIPVYYPDTRADSTTREWLIESSLDTQWARAFAPEAQISAVFAKNGSMESLLSAAEYASQMDSDIVLMCFGSEETGKDASLTGFMSEAKQIFVVSSGDRGGIVSFPSSSSDALSVGGTKAVFDSSGTRIITESAWVNGGGGASGIFAIPPWQGRFFNIYEMSDGMRGTPDVSMMANLNPGAAAYVLPLGGWTSVGGTSLSAACFAGICACIKQMHPEIVTSADMLSFLYGKAGTTSYSVPQYYFRDITMGMSGDLRAGVGWDFCTGLGSPVIRQLLL